MEDKCQIHEDSILKKIEEKVEYSVITKFNKATLWLVVSVLSVFATLVVFLVVNAKWQGTMEERDANQSKMLSDFIIEQREVNKNLQKANTIQDQNLQQDEKTYTAKLSEISSNQLIIMYNIKRFDPEFEIPKLTFRGGIQETKKEKF